jgi:hypothetical protein
VWLVIWIGGFVDVFFLVILFLCFFFSDSFLIII